VENPVKRSGAAWVLLVCVLVLTAVYSYWCATQFTGVFARLTYMDHYRYLADGMSSAALDVHDEKGAPVALCTDCLQFKGKAYIAYGPLPAVFQLITDHVLRWRVASGAIVWLLVNLALALFAATLVRFLHRVMGLGLTASLVITAGASAVLGTSEIFLHTALVPYAWSQASAAGQLLVVGALAFLLQQYLRPAPRWIAAATMCAGASALCKQNYFPALVGVAAALHVICGKGERSYWSRENARAYVVPAAVCVVLFFGYNAARFGNPFDNGTSYVNASETRPILHASPKVHRIPMNFFNHFLAGYRFNPTDWPLLAGKSEQFEGIKPDGSGGLLHNHPMFSLFLSMPLLLLGVGGGIWGAIFWYRTRGELAAWAVGGWCLAGSTFFYYLLAEASWSRYRYDFLFPLALVSVIAGVLLYRAAAPYRFVLHPVALVVLPVLFGWQSFVGIDQALGTMFSRDHRLIHWSSNLPPGYATVREKAHLLRAALLETGSEMPLWTAALPAPADFPVGTVAVVSPGDQIHRYNGFAWRKIWHENSVPAGISFVLPAARLEGWQPLLELGSGPGHAQGVGIADLGKGQYQFRYDYWGVPGCVSAPQKLQPGVLYQMWLDVQPPKNAALYVGSELVMDCAVGAFATAGETIHAGVNGIGFNTMGRRFAGRAHVLDGRSETMQAFNVPHAGVDVSVWMPEARTKDPEPLIQFGSQSAMADLLSVQYGEGNMVRLMYDHWGAASCFSKPVEMPAKRRFRIRAEVEMGAGTTRFFLDGRELFQCSNGVYLQSSSALTLGKNTLQFSTALPVFRGRAVLDAALEGLELKVKFPEAERTPTEPVAQLGNEPGRSDMLGVRYVSSGSVRLMYDHWDSPTCQSEPLAIDRDEWQTIRYALDFQTQTARFWLNGKEVAVCRNGVYENSLYSLALGRNIRGFTTVGNRFTGKVWLAGRPEEKK
jgi:hypothetical protein